MSNLVKFVIGAATLAAALVTVLGYLGVAPPEVTFLHAATPQRVIAGSPSGATELLAGPAGSPAGRATGQDRQEGVQGGTEASDRGDTKTVVPDQGTPALVTTSMDGNALLSPGFLEPAPSDIKQVESPPELRPSSHQQRCPNAVDAFVLPKPGTWYGGDAKLGGMSVKWEQSGDLYFFDPRQQAISRNGLHLVSARNIQPVGRNIWSRLGASPLSICIDTQGNVLARYGVVSLGSG